MCLSPSAYEQSIERMHELPLDNYPRGGGVGGGELRSTPFSDPVPECKEGGVCPTFTPVIRCCYMNSCSSW